MPLIAEMGHAGVASCAVAGHPSDRVTISDVGPSNLLGCLRTSPTSPTAAHGGAALGGATVNS